MHFFWLCRNVLMKLIDFHADTPSLLFEKDLPAEGNGAAADLARSRAFSAYGQVAALFCPPRLTNTTGFSHIRAMAADFRARLAKTNAVLVTDGTEFAERFASGTRTYLLSVEDLRILDGDPERLCTLHALGVRIATLVWKNQSCIGGAWNTAKGLTSFGKAAVTALYDLNIFPDLSHASVASTLDVIAIARAKKKPLLATHSAAFAVRRHYRNLPDSALREIANSGGLVGLCLYPPFLTRKDTANVTDVLRHIYYITNRFGSDLLALGCDFDGMDEAPIGLSAIDALPHLADQMKRVGFSHTQIDSLFYKNGLRFIKENIK